MFKAAFYETEVTPPLGSFIPGHYARFYAEGVKDKLYAKAVVIDNGKETVATVVLDCVELPIDCHDTVAKRVEEYTGIKPSNFTIAANHTHAGAPTKSYPDIAAYADPNYIDTMLMLMADCVTLAYRKLEPVTIKFGRSEIYDISFNRTFVMRDGTITTNSGRVIADPAPKITVPDDIPVVKFEDAHKAPGADNLNPNCVGNLAGIDPDLPVLVFENQSGEPIGAIINFACHQTASGCKELSGDYSSILSRELKLKYGMDFVSLFIIGAAGDINHIDFSKPKDDPDVYIHMGKRIADEAVKIIESAEEIKGDVLISKKEKLVLKRRQVEMDRMKNYMDSYMSTGSSMLIRNALVFDSLSWPETVEAYVQCVRIGDVYYYALPGEIFVNFGLYIKENSPGGKNLITELANGPYDGYVPTREAFHPNSQLYEIAICQGSCMEVEGGYIMADKVLELARDASAE